MTLLKHERDRLEVKVTQSAAKLEDMEIKRKELILQAEAVHTLKPQLASCQEELASSQDVLRGVLEELESVKASSRSLQSSLNARIAELDAEAGSLRTEAFDKQIRLGELEILCANQRKTIESSSRLRHELKASEEQNTKLLSAFRFYMNFGKTLKRSFI